MKQTDSQRKWALTACLATVLSFNMVLSLSGSKLGYSGMASFASSEPRYESLISNNGEAIEVKYVANEDGNTVAIVPEKLESGLCYQCGVKYLLPKNFDASASALEAALRKAMYDNKGMEVKEVSQSVSEGEDLDKKPAKKVTLPQNVKVQDEEEEQQENPDFVALRERCEKRNDDSKVRCLTTGLTKLLKNKKKVYDRDEVMDLYRSEIEPGLRSSLADVSDLVPRNNPSRYSMDMDMDLREESTRRDDAKGMIEDMLAQISGKYNYLRERLTKLAANAVLKNQEVAQQKLKQAEQMKTSNPSAALRLQNEGYARLNAANQVANDLGISLYDGLDSASANNYITSEQFDSLYYVNYGNIVQEAIRGMAQNPMTYVLPNVTLADGTTIVDQNGQTFSVTPSRDPVVQGHVNGRNIIIMSNNLTPANVATANTPRIATLNGATAQPGTASIQVLQGVAAPVNQSTLPTIRTRGQ